LLLVKDYRLLVSFILRERINNQIRARELRVIDDEDNNIGVLILEKALDLAKEKGLDLIEISPNAKPPVVKIMDYGKFQYEKNKKQKKVRAAAHLTETKSIQVKIGTSKHDLELKAKKISDWLKEGHRVKVELFLVGRSKYLDKEFQRERLERVLHLITEEYKIAEPYKKSPKGIVTIIEKK